ncbi:MAG: IgGFc-binding protein [Flavobacteriales bacterium]|nr:IgGFc-binding protein [Flavobacteriales bacterium]
MKQIHRAILWLLLFASFTGLKAQTFDGDRFWIGFMQNYDGLLVAHRVDVCGPVGTKGTIRSSAYGINESYIIGPSGCHTSFPPIPASQTSESVGQLSLEVEADRSVTVYAGSMASSSWDMVRVLPESQLGTDHLVMAYNGVTSLNGLCSELLVIGTEDSTLVEITPTANTVGGEFFGSPFTTWLGRGETFLVKALSSNDDLSGSRVRVLNPGPCRRIAVLAGSICSKVPISCNACDHLFEQMPPVNAWGTSHTVMPMAGSPLYTYRVLASEDSTQLWIDGVVQPIIMTGQPREWNDQAQAHCIASDKPVLVAQYLQGQGCSGVDSDPSFVLSPSDQQQITSGSFITGISAQLVMHTLELVIDSGAASTILLDGDTAQPLMVGPLASCPDRVHLSLALYTGAHRIEAQAPFTAIVAGRGPFESYAYALGPASQANLDSTICTPPGPVTLTAPNGMSLPIWSSATAPYDTLATGPSYTLQADSNVVITVRDTLAGTSCDGTGLYRIEVPGSISVDAYAMQSTVCPPVPAYLVVDVQPATAGLVLEWSPEPLPGTGPSDSLFIYAITSTNYQLTVMTSSGCIMATDAAAVFVAPAPTIPVITQQADTLYCSPASSYTWFFNGVPIPGADQAFLAPTSTGIYSVGIVDANGCAALSDDFPFTQNGLREQAALHVHCWHDGAGLVHLTTDRPMEYVRIWNALGQLEVESAPRAQRASIPLGSTGVHLVEVGIAGGTVVQRVLVAP